MIWVLIGWHVLVIWLLVAIGAYWLALVPVVILVVLLGYGLSARQIDSRKQEGQHLMRQFLLVWAWSMMIVGLWSLGDIIGEQLYRAWGLVVAHVCLWILAHVLEYEDGKSLFHRGYYLSAWLVAVTLWQEVTLLGALKIWALWWWLTIGIYAFVVFVLGGIWYSSSPIVGKLLYGLILAEIVYSVMIQTWGHRMIAVLLLMLLLLLLAQQTHAYVTHIPTPLHSRNESEDAFYEALYGEQALYVETPERPGLIEIRWLSDLVTQHQWLIAWSVAVTMTVLLVITMVRTVGEVTPPVLLSLYAILFTYCGGWLITRQWSTAWHRGRWVSLVWVLWVLYLTVTKVFGSDIVYVLLAGIMISIGVSLFLLYESRVMEVPLFDYYDRRVWLWWVVWLMIINSVMFLRIPLSIQFIFALLCVYLGIQGVLVWYVWKGD